MDIKEREDETYTSFQKMRHLPKCGTSNGMEEVPGLFVVPEDQIAEMTYIQQDAFKPVADSLKQHLRSTFDQSRKARDRSRSGNMSSSSSSESLSSQPASPRSPTAILDMWFTNDSTTYSSTFHKEQFVEEELQFKVFRLSRGIRLLHEKLSKEKREKEDIFKLQQICETECMRSINELITMHSEREKTLQHLISNYRARYMYLWNETEKMQHIHHEETKDLKSKLHKVEQQLFSKNDTKKDCVSQKNGACLHEYPVNEQVKILESELGALKQKVGDTESSYANMKILFELALCKLARYENGYLALKYEKRRRPITPCLKCVQEVGQEKEKNHSENGNETSSKDMASIDNASMEPFKELLVDKSSSIIPNIEFLKACAEEKNNNLPNDHDDFEKDKMIHSFSKNNISLSSSYQGSHSVQKRFLRKSMSHSEDSMKNVLNQLENLHQLSKKSNSGPDLHNAQNGTDTLVTGECDNQSFASPRTLKRVTFSQAMGGEKGKFLSDAIGSSKADFVSDEEACEDPMSILQHDEPKRPQLVRHSSDSSFARIRSRRNGITGQLLPMPFLEEKGQKHTKISKMLKNVGGTLRRKSSKEITGSLEHVNYDSAD